MKRAYVRSALLSLADENKKEGRPRVARESPAASTRHALTKRVSATQPSRESKRYVILRYCIGIVDTQVKHYPGGLI
jgi:hypothetical protein